jgi:hypothetical protein
MDNPRDDQFRTALSFLKANKRLTIAELAKMGGCSSRHIQGILSEKERKGAGRTVGHHIAAALGFSYEDMLTLGRWIIDGKSPADLQLPITKISPPTTTEQISTYSEDQAVHTSHSPSSPFDMEMDRFFELIKDWWSEEKGSSPQKVDEFRDEFKDAFPAMKTWLKKRGEDGDLGRLQEPVRNIG